MSRPILGGVYFLVGSARAQTPPGINFDEKVLTLDSQPVEGQAVVK